MGQTRVLQMQDTFLRLCASTALLGVLSLPATAQQIMNLEEITFSANLGAVALDRTGSAVTVLTEADLRALRETAVTDTLARVPGVAVAQRGPLGTQAGVTIRGVNQNNIAVRFEGIDITDPTGTQVAFDFGGLTLGGLGRIEVLRGSQSALYGSQAVGGAILLQGNRPTHPGPQTGFTIEAGSYRTFSAAYDYALATERSELSVGLGRVRTDGFSAWDARGRPDAEDDGFREKRANIFFSHMVTDATRLDVAGFWRDTTAEFDNEFSGVFSEGDNTQFKRERGARLGLSHEFEGFTLSGDVSRFDIDRTLDFAGFAVPFDGSRDAAKVEIAFSPAVGVDVVGGVQRSIERYRDANQREQVAVNSLYGQISFAPNEMTDLTFSARYDRHSEFGGNVSGRVTGVHRFSEGLRLRFSAGTGYRAPSNYELYGFFVDTSQTPPENVLVGDPTLGVERSRSFDLGVEQDFDTVSLSTTAFYLRARDLLDYSFDAGRFVQRRGFATRYGIELSGDWQATDQVMLSGAYTFTRTSLNVPLDSSGWAALVPRHVVNLTAQWQAHERLSVAANLAAVAKKPDVSDYAVVNLVGTYVLRDGIDAYLRIENLFDTQYQQVRGYGTSDRAFYLGVASRF